MAVLAAYRYSPVTFYRCRWYEHNVRPCRRWHLNTVLPMARLLEYELTMKLDSPVKLKFDTYALDMVSQGASSQQARIGGSTHDNGATGGRPG